MINRYFYKSSLSEFVKDSSDDIFGKIARNDEGDSVAEQKFAWAEEIEIMQQVLQPWKDENGEIIFEYSIPRLGKRIDVVVLLRSIVFTIEFKAGEGEDDRCDDFDCFHISSKPIDFKYSYVPS